MGIFFGGNQKISSNRSGEQNWAKFGMQSVSHANRRNRFVRFVYTSHDRPIYLFISYEVIGSDTIQLACRQHMVCVVCAAALFLIQWSKYVNYKNQIIHRVRFTIRCDCSDLMLVLWKFIAWIGETNRFHWARTWLATYNSSYCVYFFSTMNIVRFGE